MTCSPSLALWGVVAWRRHLWPAVALFALAALTRETTLVVPAACMIVGTNRQRLALLTPFGIYAAWALAVTRLVHPVLAPESSSPVADALRQFALPFQSWRELSLQSRTIQLAVLLTAASLVSAWILRHRLPELSLWLLADSILVLVAGRGVAEDILNYARLVPLAGVGIALAAWEARTRSTPTGTRHSTEAGDAGRTAAPAG